MVDTPCANDGRAATSFVGDSTVRSMMTLGLGVVIARLIGDPSTLATCSLEQARDCNSSRQASCTSPNAEGTASS